MLNMETSDLFYSIKKELERRLEYEKNRLESKKEKMKETKGKIHFFGLDPIKDIEKKMSALRQVENAFFDLNSTDSKTEALPQDVLESLKEVSSFLSEEEVNKLRSLINEALRESYREKKEEIEKRSKFAGKALQAAKLGDKSFGVYGLLHNQFKDKNITFQRALDTITSNKLNELTSGVTFFKGKESDTSYLGLMDRMMFTEIDRMAKEGKLNNSKETLDIVTNLPNIMSAYEDRGRAEHAIKVISSTYDKLKGVTNVKFTKAMEFLYRAMEAQKKELARAERFIANFDLESMKLQMKEVKAKEAEEQILQTKESRYENLAYELEKVMSEDPQNAARIAEIKEQMRAVTLGSGIPDDRLLELLDQGKERYKKEVMDKKIKAELAREKIDQEDSLHGEMMRSLREAAIKELESTGAFEGEPEYRNGDVYYSHVDREALIKRKMDELLLIAAMTPEERGLADLKKGGYLPPDTTIADLTYQQLSDFRIGYADRMYSFMPEYKAWKKDEQRKSQANTVYKEYIRYRASLEDKKTAMPFSEFAQMQFGYSEMDVSMVTEPELIEEEVMKGKTR